MLTVVPKNTPDKPNFLTKITDKIKFNNPSIITTYLSSENNPAFS